jgi:hypothetical protein
MNELDRMAYDDDGRLDRLVDGELSAAEYRSLLAALEDDPNGWRRCAMAFLEAQAWEREIPAIQTVDRREKSVSKLARNPWQWANRMAIAASLMLTFGLGVLVHREWTVPASVPGVDESHLVRRTELPSASDQKGGNSSADEIAPITNLQLMVSDGQGQSRPVDIPLYDVNRVGTEFLASDDESLPRPMLDLLQSRGFRVQRYQRYMPVELEDGRQAVVPVDRYQVVPVGSKPY